MEGQRTPTGRAAGHRAAASPFPAGDTAHVEDALAQSVAARRAHPGNLAWLLTGRRWLVLRVATDSAALVGAVAVGVVALPFAFAADVLSDIVSGFGVCVFDGVVYGLFGVLSLFE